MTHITIERENLERVLEALEVLIMKHYELTGEVLHKHIYAVLEEALAQPEQEPVEWLTGCPECGMDSGCACDSGTWNPPAAQRTWVGSGDLEDSNAYLDPPAQPAQEPFGYLSIGGNPIFQKEKPEIGRWQTLYSTPPKRPWVSLTDDQIKEIVGPWGDTPIKGYTRKLFDQIEAKLKEKNT